MELYRKFSFVFVMVILAFSGFRKSNAHLKVLHPSNKNKSLPSSALIIFGGAKCLPKSYFGLANEIQKQFPNLYVIIPQCYFLFCCTYQIEQLTKLSLRMIDSFPETIEAVFLSGHSFGAASLGQFSLRKLLDSRIKGIILMGGYTVRDLYKTKMNKKLPILTLGSELDGGAAMPVRMAEEYFWSLRRGDNESVISMSPVILVPGASHLQFASLDVPKSIKKTDLKPEISWDKAHMQMATYIVSFMNIHRMSSSLEKREHSKKILKKGMFTITEQILGPIIAAFEYEGHYLFGIGKKQSQFTKDVQFLVSGLSAKQFNTLFNQTNESMRLIDMIKTGAKPSLKGKMITTFTGFRMPLAAYYDASNLAAPLEMLLKLKGRDEFMLDEAFNGSQQCQLIQQRSIRWAWKRIPQKTKQRFRKNGQNLMVVPAQKHLIGISWLMGRIGTKDFQSDGFEVQPQFLLSQKKFWPKSIAGMFYCKVWGPSKIMEWFYTQGLRMKQSLLSTDVVQLLL